MPTYLDALRGVSYTEALLEAAHVAPTSAAVLETFELWHESLAEPIYLVSNTEDFVATKEADADRDPSTEVEFMAAAVALEIAEESDASATPELRLTVSNVSGVMSDALDLALGSLVPWVIINRLYASDDTSAPARLPVTSLLVSAVQMTAQQVTLTCSYGDPANTAIPRTTFKRDEYPGLVR
jgi:hypothetical protein